MNANSGPAPWNLSARLANFAVDALKLADLQLQMWTVDLKTFWLGARTSIALHAIGSVILLASLPVAMLGAAEYLRHALEWPFERTLLLIAGVAAAFALSLVWYAMQQLKVASSHLKNSSDELRENLRWIRQELHDEDAAR